MKKPIEKIVYIRRKIWDCGIKDHHHTKMEVAQQCIDRQNSSVCHLSKKEMQKDRRFGVVIRVLEGDSYEKVGELYGISGGRVRQIVEKELRKLRLALKGSRCFVLDEIYKSGGGIKKYRENSKILIPIVKFSRDHNIGQLAWILTKDNKFLERISLLGAEQ